MEQLMELLNDMALFVEVVKAKGFRNAAEATGLPNSTVSRRISNLECVFRVIRPGISRTSGHLFHANSATHFGSFGRAVGA
jgi:hypothetical protein